MIRDLKLGLKVLKYALNADDSTIALVVSFVAGVFFQYLLPFGMSGCFWGIGMMIVIQMLFSTSVSTMVQSSAHKKRLQTTIPTIIGSGLLVVGNTISLIITWFGYQRILNNRDNFYFYVRLEPGEVEMGILFSSVLMVWLVLNQFVVTRYFWLGSICLWAPLLYVSIYVRMVEEMTYPIIPMMTAVIFSYVIILIGCVLMYLIARLNYKKEYSKLVFAKFLK